MLKSSILSCCENPATATITMHKRAWSASGKLKFMTLSRYGGWIDICDFHLIFLVFLCFMMQKFLHQLSSCDRWYLPLLCVYWQAWGKYLHLAFLLLYKSKWRHFLRRRGWIIVYFELGTFSNVCSRISYMVWCTVEVYLVRRTVYCSSRIKLILIKIKFDKRFVRGLCICGDNATTWMQIFSYFLLNWQLSVKKNMMMSHISQGRL